MSAQQQYIPDHHQDTLLFHPPYISLQRQPTLLKRKAVERGGLIWTCAMVRPSTMACPPTECRSPAMSLWNSKCMLQFSIKPLFRKPGCRSRTSARPRADAKEPGKWQSTATWTQSSRSSSRVHGDAAKASAYSRMDASQYTPTRSPSVGLETTSRASGFLEGIREWLRGLQQCKTSKLWKWA